MRRQGLPRDRRDRFVNWARTQHSQPTGWDRPTGEDEVVSLVRAARAAGGTLRVVGSGHSWSRIAAPEGVAVSLDRLQGPVDVAPDRESVTAPAGMRLSDLSAVLLAQGLALPVVGSIQAQTLAGAIATGTHGSSLVHGNVSTLVTGVRLVTGTGEVLDITGDDRRLDGVRVHLGALGVLTRVALRVRPAVRLRQTVESVPVPDLPPALAEVAGSTEYVKAWWLPHASTAQIVRYAQTDEPDTRRPSARTSRWIDERVMHPFVFPALTAAQHRRPSLTAGLNERLSRVYLGAATQVGQDGLMLNTPMPMRHRETEAALPLTAAPDALREVLALFQSGRPSVTFPLEIRFVRGDESWLSPAQGADTCQIGAYSTDGPDCAGFFASFWAVMRSHGARPHWGKELDHTVAELAPLYPELQRFQALRRTWDPEGVFAGSFHHQVLGA